MLNKKKKNGAHYIVKFKTKLKGCKKLKMHHRKKFKTNLKGCKNAS
jgi:hypothetical protein